MEFIFWKQSCKVWGDPKLLDDTGEVPKIEWSGLRFDSRPWNLLFVDRKTSKMAMRLICWK